MLDRVDLPSAERVVALLRPMLAKRGVDRPAAPDDDLTALGLSSLDLVNLMLAVEAEFDIKIPDRDMTPSNFRTVARIDGLIGALSRNA